MKKLIKFSAVAVAVACCITAAKAVPITGTISFVGIGTESGGSDIGNATGFSSFFVISAPLATGDYAGAQLLPQGTITMNGFSFNPFGGAVTPLWDFIMAGNTFTFDLNNVTSVSQGYSAGIPFLHIVGNGIAEINGARATPGEWRLDSNTGSGASFVFASSTTAVPDGGFTVGLLGLEVAGFGFVRRKIA